MKHCLIVFLLLIGGSEAYGVELNRDYFKGYFLDTKSILTLSSWERKDWIKVGLITGITAGLYHFDSKIQEWVQENRNNTSDKIANFAKPFGDGKYTLPPLCVFYFYGHFFEDKKAKRVSLLSLESFVVSGIFTQGIKFTGHRHRPSTGDSYNTWDGPSFSKSNLSFPSGHSSSAFSIASVIATEYDNRFIPPLAYGIATLTALSRVNDNAHWPSDVFFGSCLGYFTAKGIVALHKKDIGLIISPTSLSFLYRF